MAPDQAGTDPPPGGREGSPCLPGHSRALSDPSPPPGVGRIRRAANRTVQVALSLVPPVLLGVPPVSPLSPSPLSVGPPTFPGPWRQAGVSPPLGLRVPWRLVPCAWFPHFGWFGDGVCCLCGLDAGEGLMAFLGRLAILIFEQVSENSPAKSDI